MKHFILTIGCEYGSGGPDIGRMIANDFGIEYYDRDLVDSVVEKTGVDKELVEKADKSTKVKFRFDTTYGARYGNLSNRVIQTQFDVIQDLANKGDSCIFIGRSSDYILKDRPDVINIFIYAPMEFKVEHMMKEKGISKAEAENMVKSYEASLHARHKYITGKSRGDRSTRDLMLDSSVLGLEKTAKFIEEYIKMVTAE